MSAIHFTKMVASGNDFVVTEAKSLKAKVKSLRILAKKICDRKYGAGADGLLVLDKPKAAGVRMRIFNADGSEAAMCGNGARCAALYTGKTRLRIGTKAGIIESEVNRDSVRIKLTEPKNIKLNMPIKVSGRTLRINFIDTGVPHAVIFVEGLDKIDVAGLGNKIRFHRSFAPKGTNVDFVQLLSNNSIKVRTYERGVEDETLSCGTGAVASALIFAIRCLPPAMRRIIVRTKDRGMLRVWFGKSGNKFKNVWLEGEARIVYSGVYYV